MKGRANSSSLIPVAAVLLVLFAPGGASAATVLNGGFESGTLNGWQVRRATEAGNWFAYEGTDAPIGSKRGADPVQAPPRGDYAGIADEANPDTLILYQDVSLEAGYDHRLSLLAYYDSYEPIAIPTPDTLSIDDEVLKGQANQQYRIDVMRPTAPLESLDPADILRTLFHTKPGDPLAMPPTRLTADLSPFAGQTVRLRIASAVHEEVLNAGVDAVSISSTPPGQLPPGGSGGSNPRSPNRFSVGKAKANRKNGTATLPVQVPGPGRLTVKEKKASTSSLAARVSKSGKSRKLIEPASVRAAAAGTVTIRLRPTASARAILRQKHKLRLMVTVKYAPTNGSSQEESVPVVLKLAASPQRRR